MKREFCWLFYEMIFLYLWNLVICLKKKQFLDLGHLRQTAVGKEWGAMRVENRVGKSSNPDWTETHFEILGMMMNTSYLTLQYLNQVVENGGLVLLTDTMALLDWF